MMTPHSPYARTMGFSIERDADNRPVLVMPWDDNKAGRPGFVHGGALAGLMETAAFLTVAEALGEDDKALVKPINVTVSYMRGARQKATYARATIERLGRRIANVEVAAWQDDPASPVAMAQMNLMLSRDEAPDLLNPRS
jgi:uncharacterized protein (TIGR00369 family)